MTISKPNAQNRILEAAECLMLQEGFHGVSVDRIITAAGVSKGSFFYHFPTKDSLPAALLERFLDRQGAAMSALMADANAASTDPLARACLVIEGLAPLFTHALQGAPGCVMAAFSYQLSPDFPELQKISQAAVRGWRQHFGVLLAPLTEKHPQLPDGEALAEHLLCCLQGASILARIKGDPTPVAEAARQFSLYLTCLQSSAGLASSENATSAYTGAIVSPRQDP
jgi:AcrR family transcriptional regulator